MTYITLFSLKMNYFIRVFLFPIVWNYLCSNVAGLAALDQDYRMNISAKQEFVRFKYEFSYEYFLIFPSRVMVQTWKIFFKSRLHLKFFFKTNASLLNCEEELSLLDV